MKHIKVKVDPTGKMVVETDYACSDMDHYFILKSTLGNIMRANGIGELEASFSEGGDGDWAIKEAFDEEFKKTSFDGRGYYKGRML